MTSRPTTADRGRCARARERAVDFLLRCDLPSRRTADGFPLGIQATLATGRGPLDALDVSRIEAKLGFPLEPELFSNMLFAACLGGDPNAGLKALCDLALSTFRELHADGLYHFFRSLKFACDIDCTAVAAKARLVCGDIDLATAAGRSELAVINDAILRSAAVCDVLAEKNLTHGKHNGALRRHVFKVYPDDHRVQAEGLDRGLKINPVVASNALYPVLTEIERGLRQHDELVELVEYVEGAARPRVDRATVASIVAENVAYVAGHLASGEWREGCRYYASPDVFLFSLSENLRAFPDIFAPFDAIAGMRRAIDERRRTTAGGDVATDPTTSLNTALRALAALNVGAFAAPEIEHLLARQDPSGGFTDPDSMFCFGESAQVPVHFRSSLVTTAFAIRALGADGLTQRDRASSESRPRLDTET
jgi:hypothetical protein